MTDNVSMVNEVSICNQALSWVGANFITDLTGLEPGSNWCRNNYEFLRDAVLEEHTWTFATQRATSESANKSEWGDYFEHAVPPNWLIVFRVSQFPTDEPTEYDWKKEDNKILAPDQNIFMWGTQRVVDTSKFSNMFVQALAARLATDMAVPFTENRQLQKDLWDLYNAKIDAAAARDGMQGKNERARARRLHRVRHGRVI